MVFDSEFLLMVSGALLLILVFLILYIYIKDKDVAKKTQRLEKAIEALSKEIYKTKKWIQENETQSEFANSTLGANIKNEVKNNLNSGLTNLSSQIHGIQEVLEKDRDYFEEKIIALENKIREFGHFSPSSTDVDENRIIKMFQDGWSIDSIAKELRVGKGEVEFILKLADIK
ncbi:DUF6115 domain-containing protein [Helicobacter cappadocius]|uniref:Helix-turn-helix domain-containing protein n=1 Tax=Helicobacter cappadocius TaxID=3063998 RepID=A0AA90PTT0_9HELI|nr:MULTISPECIES: helix-turn-helix domain-containing protein [unclassified Helicobacter]MDO7253487.1 helix-turn-helix domain-containing protein [Helicobacter sp. faydin-H75]MDP2539414.1 helix-turn-helix domain-containing protein [Helicobacter sp. faydin-H76]